MNRRNFLAASLSALAVSIPGMGDQSSIITACKPIARVGCNPDLVPLYRFENGCWVKRLMRELGVGDRFIMDTMDASQRGIQIWMATGLPEQVAGEEYWSITAESSDPTRADLAPLLDPPSPMG